MYYFLSIPVFELCKPLLNAELGTHRDTPVSLDSDGPLEVEFDISSSIGIVICWLCRGKDVLF